jgi:hypothetical protein
MTPEERELLVLADSYLSWALHRYAERWTPDFKKDVAELLIELRKYS